LKQFQKAVSVGAGVTSDGRLFQRQLPATINARSPTVNISQGETNIAIWQANSPGQRVTTNYSCTRHNGHLICTRSSTTAKSTACPSCLVGLLY